MIRSVKSLIGYTMGATDGEIGKVKELFFDDETWTVRYLVVETGSFLFGRKVLISPEALLSPDWKKGIFPVNLTIDQIKNSPDINTDEPVSRQQEIKLYDHYPWTGYWTGGLYAGGMLIPMPVYMQNNEKEDLIPRKDVEGDSHLRSTKKVTGYNIQATDGEIGDVEDFCIDDSTWKIDFMIVDTGNWFPGKKVLISPKWIKEISWIDSKVIIKALIEDVKSSPELDSEELISKD